MSAPRNAPPKRTITQRVLGAFGIETARRSAQRPPARRSVYAAARVDDLVADWLVRCLSADESIKGDLRKMRDRARGLVRDNEYAARYLGLLEENVVGHYGIELQAANKLGSGRLNRPVNQKIEAAWRDWSDPETASYDEKLSWPDIQRLVIRSLGQDGEALIRMIPGAPNRFGFALQPLDPDLLDHELNREASSRGNAIRMGVEVDDRGRAVAYWLLTAHPSETRSGTKPYERVPADQMIHLYVMQRPGQTRGVPWLAPVMFGLHMLHGYQEAELVAARLAAAQGVLYEQDPDIVQDPEDNREALVEEVVPGQDRVLPPGFKPHFRNPTHPNTSFKEFHAAVMQGIAAGGNVAYTSLSGNLERVNYSSIRAGLFSERDFYRWLHTWLPTHLHRRVHREWMKWSLTTGALQLPTTDTARIGAAMWLPRGWPWVDPLNDLQAAEKEIALGLNSRTNLCAERGRDYAENLDDLQQEAELASEKGVSVTPAAGSGTPAPTGAPDDDDEDEDEAGKRRLVAL